MNYRELKDKKLFLLDMDGTIYIDNKIFEGAKKFLEYIKSIGGRYIFLTNNSSKGVEDYIKKLCIMGIETSKDDFSTSSQATALYLKDRYKSKKVYVMGTDSLKREFIENQIKVTDKYEEDIHCLVVGYDTELTYTKLVDACKLLIKGVDFIATNPDFVCPTSFGFIPDCGSICNMLKIATGREPSYIGKPMATMVSMAVERSGFSKDQVILIGDRLYTDIACGINAGVTTALVLTGETKREDIEKSPFKPDYLFEDIKELLRFLTSKN
jgi:HAD superfamily hydrolase (TIGR01457 family)